MPVLAEFKKRSPADSLRTPTLECFALSLAGQMKDMVMASVSEHREIIDWYALQGYRFAGMIPTEVSATGCPPESCQASRRADSRPFFIARPYSSRRVKAVRRIVGKVTALLKYVIFMLLALGLVWCACFLVLEIIFIRQADYHRFCYMLFETVKR